MATTRFGDSGVPVSRCSCAPMPSSSHAPCCFPRIAPLRCTCIPAAPAIHIAISNTFTITLASNTCFSMARPLLSTAFSTLISRAPAWVLSSNGPTPRPSRCRSKRQCRGIFCPLPRLPCCWMASSALFFIFAASRASPAAGAFPSSILSWGRRFLPRSCSASAAISA
jgi:hypothetical protein